MITLKHRTSLVDARWRANNYPIETLDEGDGQVWLFGAIAMSAIPTFVIRATSFEAAWELALDEMPTIDAADVPEAYGFDGENGELELRQAVERAEAGLEEYPELIEGYEMQPNCTGTGIVNVGHYAWLREMTRDDAAAVRLVVRDWEDEPTHVRFELESYAYTLIVGDKRKRFSSYSLLSDVGERVRRLERAYTTVVVSRTWTDA